MKDDNSSDLSGSKSFKNYSPYEVEKHWYQYWQQQGFFKLSDPKAPSYTIMIPPPNVTGSLHIGHAFQLSIMDALVRFHKLHGKNVLWQLGTDHAGIATQLVAENWLKRQNIDRSTLSREAFLDKVWEWKEYSSTKITDQQKRLGICADWDRQRFTLDHGFNQAVTDLFVRLYDEKIIYRGKRLVNWDPVLQTAVSDLEVINEDTNGQLYYVRYPLAEGSDAEGVVVATTRPETMFGDVAVAVHPSDPRYAKFIGCSLRLPLTERLIPVIADDYVDPEFGTGAVKITPAHDFNDYQVGLRHNLEMPSVLTKLGTLNDLAPADLVGLSVSEARPRLVAKLNEGGWLVKQEPHQLKVPHGDRSGAVIEPMLTDQWFLAATKLAPAAKEAVVNGDTRFIPANWEKTYFQWLDNIQDWCISRQLWWGHRIPAWYDDSGNIYVAKDEAAVREKYHLNSSIQLKQEDDVLDTWFSSALWPLVTLGWPDKLDEFKLRYPTAVLVTGFDIIFFWVARMMMMALHLVGKVPFFDVYITGLIRDSQGQKMSKSKGNVLDPMDLIDGISLDALLTKRTSYLMQEHLAKKIAEQTKREFPSGIEGYGADALRFTLCAQASMSRDINFDMSRLAGYRNLGTKLWNATRFVLMQLPKDFKPVAKIAPTPATCWMVLELTKSVKLIEEHFKTYRFDLATQELYNLIWQRFCDWYLELAKVEVAANLAVQAGLVICLSRILIMLHPFMPFLTEELWQEVRNYLADAPSSIMLAKYPQLEEFKTACDEAAASKIKWLQEVVLAVRSARSDLGLAPQQRLQLRFVKGEAAQREQLLELTSYLAKLARVELASDVAASDNAVAATLVVNGAELALELDADAFSKEKDRLASELTKLTKESDMLSAKLNNAEYCKRAPSEIVQRDRDRLALLQTKKSRLQAALNKAK